MLATCHGFGNIPRWKNVNFFIILNGKLKKNHVWMEMMKMEKGTDQV